MILQSKSLDLSRASDLVGSVIQTLETRRQEVTEHFETIFSQAQAMAEKLDAEIKKPRICGRQTRRENYNVESVENYYRVLAYIPLLDQVGHDLKERFSPEVLNSFNLPNLIPKKVVKLESSDKNALVNTLMEQFGQLPNMHINEISLRSELDHWKTRCNNMHEDELETEAIQSLKSCDQDVYPTILKLLQILCTLPVTNASAERSFSTLRLLKTWLRTTMGETRLTGLALLHCHYNLHVNPEKVIQRLAKMSKNNRLGIVL